MSSSLMDGCDKVPIQKLLFKQSWYKYKVIFFGDLFPFPLFPDMKKKFKYETCLVGSCLWKQCLNKWKNDILGSYLTIPLLFLAAKEYLL